MKKGKEIQLQMIKVLISHSIGVIKTVKNYTDRGGNNSEVISDFLKTVEEDLKCVTNTLRIK